MITADKIRRCAYLSTPELEKALQFMYPKDTIISSKFLGITNGGQFCYSAVYFDETIEENTTAKVFVDTDCNNELYAEY